MNNQVSNADKPTELYWEDVRDDIKSVNPTLADIIDRISPTKKFSFFKIRYPFGVFTYKQGVLQIPDANNQMLPITHSSVNQVFKDKLTYRFVPLSVITKGVTEVFLESKYRTRSLRLYKPGEMFGLFELFDKPGIDTTAPISNSTAGPKSMFMAPKVTDRVSHQRLAKEFDFQLPVPKDLSDHWKIFHEIAKHENTDKKWFHEMIFFSSAWLEETTDSPAWVDFYKYLTSSAWYHAQYRRTQTTFCEIWEDFINNVVAKRLKPRQYLIDTVRYLRFIAKGDIPGFRCALPDDGEIAPIRFLQTAYKEVYGLKIYAPLIVYPDQFDPEIEKRPVYYSLGMPTLIEFALEPVKKVPSTLSDLCEVATLMGILENTIKHDNSGVYQVRKDIRFDYFHNELDKYGIIKPTNQIPSQDKSIEQQTSSEKENIFSEASSFFRGCVRISNEC